MRSAGRWRLPVGSDTVKVVPLPSSLVTSTLPPCIATSSRTSASPIPEPSCVRARARSTRWNRSNTCGRSSVGMPTPVSRTVIVTRRPVPGQRHRNRAGERELEGVREKVEHDLLPHVAIEVHRVGERRTVDDQLQPCPLGRRPERAGQVRRDRREIGRLEHGLYPAGLDARKIEQRVDELEQTLRIAMHRLQIGALQHAVRRPGGFLGRPEQQGQRRAELMADIAEERGLGAIELGERLRAGLRLLERPGTDDGGTDLRRDRREKVRVGRVEHEAWAQPRDQDADGPALALLRDRKNQRARDPRHARWCRGEGTSTMMASRGLHGPADRPQVACVLLQRQPLPARHPRRW